MEIQLIFFNSFNCNCQQLLSVVLQALVCSMCALTPPLVLTLTVLMLPHTTAPSSVSRKLSYFPGGGIHSSEDRDASLRTIPTDASNSTEYSEGSAELPRSRDGWDVPLLPRSIDGWDVPLFQAHEARATIPTHNNNSISNGYYNYSVDLPNFRLRIRPARGQSRHTNAIIIYINNDTRGYSPPSVRRSRNAFAAQTNNPNVHANRRTQSRYHNVIRHNSRHNQADFGNVELNRKSYDHSQNKYPSYSERFFNGHPRRSSRVHQNRMRQAAGESPYSPGSETNGPYSFHPQYVRAPSHAQSIISSYKYQPETLHRDLQHSQHVFDSQYFPDCQHVLNSKYFPDSQHVLNSQYLPDSQHVLDSQYFPDSQHVFDSQYSQDSQHFLDSILHDSQHLLDRSHLLDNQYLLDYKHPIDDNQHLTDNNQHLLDHPYLIDNQQPLSYQPPTEFPESQYRVDVSSPSSFTPSDASGDSPARSQESRQVSADEQLNEIEEKRPSSTLKGTEDLKVGRALNIFSRYGFLTLSVKVTF